MGNKMSGSSTEMPITSPHFVLKTPIKGQFEGMEQVVFGTGCFWGAEKGFWRMPGVYTTAVGYAGGSIENPTYEQTCSGRSGHTEAVLVVFDPKKLSFVDIMRQFLQCHDPRQKDGQGNDRGTQYRGAFYYSNEEQKQIGLAAIKQYEKQLNGKIQTEVKALSDSNKFFYAEEAHQQYLAKPGSRPYCSAMPTGVQLADYKEWCPTDLQKKYAPKLGEDYWKVHAPSPHCVIREPNEQISWPAKM